jgi:ABC-type Fe3+ transport system substrate-binding protein
VGIDVFTNVEYLCIMKLRRIWPYLILFFLLNSCGLETAKPFKYQFVHVISDCLASHDSMLFSDFTQRTGIHVRIIPADAQEIQKRLKKEGTNTEIDVVVAHSTYDILILDQKNHLQRIPKDSLPVGFNSKYTSHRCAALGLGFDPYIIVQRGASHPVKNYVSLLFSQGYCTDLHKNSDLVPFYLSIFRRHKGLAPSTASAWIDNFKQKKVKVLSANDTLIYASLLFTKRSSFMKNKGEALIQFKSGEVIYPNQRIGGAYYDMPCMAIVKQARNYTNALALMRYFISCNGNIKLNHRLQTISFYANTRMTRFKRFTSSPLRLEEFIHKSELLIP